MTKKPLITKLSPNQTDIRGNARLCIEAGTDAFSVINTLMGMAIDVRTRRPVLGNVQGGLSGPAIKPIALLKVKEVHEVAAPHGIPIIGQGGITNATDALEFLIAWPALNEAAALVLARTAEIDGLAVDSLEPAVRALEGRHPLAATLLLRAMVADILRFAQHALYARALVWLDEAAALAVQIDDFGGHGDHTAFERGLRGAIGRLS